MATCTVKEYISSKKGTFAKIEALEALIDKMILDSIDDDGNVPDWLKNSGVVSYSMDDGQMKVSTQYRGVKDFLNGITALERLLERYRNRYNGRCTVLRGRLNY